MRVVRRTAVALHIAGRTRLLSVLLRSKRAPHVVQLFLVDQGLHGVGALVVPVLVKTARELLHQWTGDQHIGVDEVGLRVAKIRVTQIAPTHHTHHVVGEKQLVVHALLRALKVAHRMPHAPDRGFPITGQRVEHPHLHIGHKRHPHHQRVAPRAMKVVEQNPHPHPTLRRSHDRQHQALGTGIRVNRVVLQIERLPRVLDQGQAPTVGRLRTAEQLEPRCTRARLVFLLLAALGDLQKRCVGCRFDGVGDGAVNVGGEFGGTAGQQGDGRCYQQAGQRKAYGRTCTAVRAM